MTQIRTTHSVILTPDQRLRVFVSSTLREMADERASVREAINSVRLVPVMFESGARPHPAQELYRAYLAQSHIFIGLYWQSYGWVGPGMSISGLEDEFILSEGMPRLIYIKSPAPERQEALTAMLERLKTHDSLAFKYFSTTAELRDLVENDLLLLLVEKFESARAAPLVQKVEEAKVDALKRPAGNIPVPRNPLIDRKLELERACRLLSQDGVGLVTLTGPGGTGKSRLGLQIALDMQPIFADGSYLVSLAPVTDPSMVLPAIAETLRLNRPGDDRPVFARVVDFLISHKVLLLLDNFEQVIEAAPVISELVEACEWIKIVVTSRTPLQVRGEKEIFVPPLAIPADYTPTAALRASPSVELFVQRARDGKADFSFNDADLEAAAGICKRLDGLPLAIELAAARVKLMTPRELLKRLENSFDVLRGGTRDLPIRQQTLRSTIDWSYQLLAEEPRMLFRRLAVFHGSQWTLEDAESVCSLSCDLDVLECMEVLVKNSLLNRIVDEEGISRFGMYSTLQAYAREKLIETGELDEMQRSHAAYYTAYVVQITPLLKSSGRAVYFKLLNQAIENIRSVMEWSLASRDRVEFAEKIIIQMGWITKLTSNLPEAKQWLEQIFAYMDDDTPPLIQGEINVLMGGYLWTEGHFEKSAMHLDESLRIARSLNHKPLLANALVLRGLTAVAGFGDFDSGIALFDECVTVSKDMNDLWTESLAYSRLGDVALFQQDIPRARKMHEHSASLARLIGDPWSIASTLQPIAHIALMTGDLDKAREINAETITLYREANDEWTLSWAYAGLGHTEYQAGNLTAARDAFLRGLILAKRTSNRSAMLFEVVGAALLMTETAREDSLAEAACHFCNVNVAHKPRQRLYYWFGWREVLEKASGKVRAWAGNDTWEKALAVNPPMTLEEAGVLAETYLKTGNIK